MTWDSSNDSYVQPALIAPYSNPPKFSLEIEQGLSGQYLVSLS